MKTNIAISLITASAWLTAPTTLAQPTEAPPPAVGWETASEREAQARPFMRRERLRAQSDVQGPARQGYGRPLSQADRPGFAPQRQGYGPQQRLGRSHTAEWTPRPGARPYGRGQANAQQPGRRGGPPAINMGQCRRDCDCACHNPGAQMRGPRRAMLQDQAVTPQGRAYGRGQAMAPQGRGAGQRLAMGPRGRSFDQPGQLRQRGPAWQQQEPGQQWNRPGFGPRGGARNADDARPRRQRLNQQAPSPAPEAEEMTPRVEE